MIIFIFSNKLTKKLKNIKTKNGKIVNNLYIPLRVGGFFRSIVKLVLHNKETQVTQFTCWYTFIHVIYT